MLHDVGEMSDELARGMAASKQPEVADAADEPEEGSEGAPREVSSAAAGRSLDVPAQWQEVRNVADRKL